MVIRKNGRFVLSGPGIIESYIHLGGKIGVLVEAGCGAEATAQNAEFKAVVKDIAMHIAALNPTCLDRESVPANVLVSEREIFAKQIQGKPANIVDKIVDGKIKKFYSETCLIEQGFVKDPKQTVTQHLDAKSKAIGDKITIRRFLRYQVGQKD